jgi:hypothetical protein
MEEKMANEDKKPAGPDLAVGISTGDLPEGAMLAGHVGDDEVLLVRQGGKLFALSAHCTAGPDRRTQYNGRADAIQIGAVFLESAF